MIFLFALFAAIGAYSLLLAWQRDNVRTAAPTPFKRTTEPLPPQPLPSAPPVIDAAADIGMHEPGWEVRVTVEGSAPPGLPLAVAILDARDGTPWGFAPVDTAKLPLVVPVTGIPAGEHLVCLVRSAGEAKYGYLDRALVEVSPAVDERTSRVKLSARVQDVRIQLLCADRPDLVANTVPVIRRADDPHWRLLASLPASSVETPMRMTDGQGVLRLRNLGPGNYTLELTEPWLENGVQEFTFRIPGPERLEFICRAR